MKLCKCERRAKEKIFSKRKAEYKEGYRYINYKANDSDKLKMQQTSNCYECWLSYIEQGKQIEEDFHNNNIHTIAVYGAGKIGQHLITQT